MRTIRGPALFLAQFAGDTAPFNNWDGITAWAASLGYVGVQVPSWDARLIDLDLAATSQDYRDEFLGVARANGVEVTELSTHLQGQLVAVHPAYDAGFDGFAPASVHGNPGAREPSGPDHRNRSPTRTRRSTRPSVRRVPRRTPVAPATSAATPAAAAGPNRQPRPLSTDWAHPADCPRVVCAWWRSAGSARSAAT